MPLTPPLLLARAARSSIACWISCSSAGMKFMVGSAGGMRHTIIHCSLEKRASHREATCTARYCWESVVPLRGFGARQP